MTAIYKNKYEHILIKRTPAVKSTDFHSPDILFHKTNSSHFDGVDISLRTPSVSPLRALYSDAPNTPVCVLFSQGVHYKEK